MASLRLHLTQSRVSVRHCAARVRVDADDDDEGRRNDYALTELKKASSISTMASSFNIDLSSYPPAPVLWFTFLVDTLCMPLKCSDWRSSFDASSMLSHKVPSLWKSLPPLLSYHDYKEQHPDGTLYEYAFETPSTSLGDLTKPEAMLTLLALVVLLRGIKSILLPLFCAIGRRAGRSTHGVDWEASNEARITKFGEYVFRLCYHSLISVYGIYYFWNSAWWNDTLALYQGFPYHAVEPSMAWYYLLQGAYNLDALVSLLQLSFQVKVVSPRRGMIRVQWSENVRGDFREMFIHHVVTNLLVIGSSTCRLTRIGSTVSRQCACCLRGAPTFSLFLLLILLL